MRRNALTPPPFFFVPDLTMRRAVRVRKQEPLLSPRVSVPPDIHFLSDSLFFSKKTRCGLSRGSGIE